MRRTTTKLIEHRRRPAFSLLELAVVMAVLGVIAVAATSMRGSTQVVASLEARQEAQHLAAAFRTARATAIARTTNVHIQAVRSGRTIAGFQTLVNGTQVIQPEHRFGNSTQVSWSSPEIVFLPTGMTDRSLTISIVGQRATWQVQVLSASGQVSVVRRR